jgi:methylthioribose-1-phosphate isomerase
MLPEVPSALEWVGDPITGTLRLLDQTRLPETETTLECRDVDAVVTAIRRLSVRGAPAIGIAAAYGCVLGAQAGRLDSAFEDLAASRPTAVNLFWALERMRALGSSDPDTLLAEAHAIREEDSAMCHAIGEHGLALLPDPATVLTICNAGALATGGSGTATAPIYLAHEHGRSVRVIACETRPLLQGARLTAWELSRAGIDVTVIADGAAGSAIRQLEVDLVITGADRIAANGDAANKIGTSTLSLLAADAGIPFYVAAPVSTIDLGTPSGIEIPIECRSEGEVTRLAGSPVAARGVKAWNPAFDVASHERITALITDRGIVRPVTAEGVGAVVAEVV